MSNVGRTLVGLASIGTAVAVVAGAAYLFQGGLEDTVPVTVLSQRAGLVMYPDAKVQMRGITVGKVTSIDERPDGSAAIKLAINTAQLQMIPDDVSVDIAATTVFGAKFVQLIPPDHPDGKSLSAGQVFDAGHVTVEINTVFQQLTQVLGRVDPEKLNETLGAIAAATRGKGDQTGKMLTDLESFLAQLEPSLPALTNDLTQTPVVANAYADAAPDLVGVLSDATHIGQTLTDEKDNLDALLTGLIGLSDTGTQVLGDNRSVLTDTLHELVPTLQLTNEYHEAITCSIEGFYKLSQSPPAKVEGLAISANFLLGTNSYKYPENLPKVNAKGGPQCEVLPVPYEGKPKFVITDDGANPFERNSSGFTLNTESLQQLLFGIPQDGSPR